MLGGLKKIYECLPKSLFSFLKNLSDSLLFGKSYQIWKSKVSFEKSLFAINLAETLNYARKHTQYGKDYIPEDITPENAISVLETLPIVTSKHLASDLSYFTSDEFSSLNAYTTTTGGTGRNPTKILLSNELYGIEWAHVHDIWGYAGYNRKTDLKLTLRGKALKGKKLVDFSPIQNELIVDVYKVNLKTFPDFLKAIEPYDIKFIHGYPSLIKQYIEYFREFKVQLNLKGVLLTSEGSTVEEKKFIQNFFKCKVISFYGQSERALIAVDVESNGIYKVYSSYGYPRVVEGELVVTSFVNKAMPLINYNLGDSAEILEDKHSFYLKNLVSRRGKDFIYYDAQTRTSVTLLAMNTGVEEDILYYQFHQKEFAFIEVRLLLKRHIVHPPSEISKKFQEAIQKEIPGFTITVSIVDESKIIKSERGKMMLLIQELKI